jgi:hypothetical protein
MDVQKTMEFILQQQVKAEGQMAAIRKLIQTGMRMIVKNEELKLKSLIDAWRRGGNGRHAKN